MPAIFDQVNTLCSTNVCPSRSICGSTAGQTKPTINDYIAPGDLINRGEGGRLCRLCLLRFLFSSNTWRKNVIIKKQPSGGSPKRFLEFFKTPGRKFIHLLCCRLFDLNLELIIKILPINSFTGIFLRFFYSFNYFRSHKKRKDNLETLAAPAAFSLQFELQKLLEPSPREPA